MTKKASTTKPPTKSTHGGKRPGAGRKLIAGEHKKKEGIKVYPSDKSNIINKHGSLQKGVDWLAEQCKPLI